MKKNFCLIIENPSDADSNILSSFIAHQVQNKKPVTLSHCLRVLANKDYFDYFRVCKLLNYPSLDSPDREQMWQLLKLLYNERIVKANFTTAIRYKESTIIISPWENLLSQVFKKYGFATEPVILIDMFCMDMEGLRNFKSYHYTIERKPSLSEKILEHLTPKQQEEAAKVIMRRLQKGIFVEEILENHLSLCRKLNIYQARETILSLLLNKQIRSYHTFEVAEIFVDLGGDWAQVVAVFEAFQQYDDTGYLSFVSKLKNDHPDVVIKSLTRAIEVPEVSLDRRLNYAQLLMELGDIQGFYFIVECLRKNVPLSSGPSMHFQLQNFDTTLMINKLAPIMSIFLEETYQDFHIKDPKSLLVDLLSSIAEKSEDDLLLVDALLESTLRSTSSGEKSGFNINRYQERILENFRDKGDKPLPLNEVAEMLKEIA